ncbi:NADH pyrophosphatase [Methylobacterium adhaesivum]|uniref:NAD(+) diphosphatase n=1 Tax=Methylobacterium adhaesivum TaxID=333297 RepID=A0ABT8BK84_9HYPH|nr:NAD(+) diphosphatase [Methylobacterium adhaesivum]MDN3592531.1 NAD(+) diphosphatase [Methylobacterium adhaesivum]GJD30135.1 NADH pyrophosphatase [Methylobacterium adhaesivum]
MTDVRDGLGYVHNRLVRHSAESLAPVPSLTEPGARLVAMAGDRVVLGDGSALLDPARIAPEGILLFLGRLDGVPVFATALPPERAEAFEAVPGFATNDLRSLAAEGGVAPHELGLLATAKSLLSWHARNGFCAQCGTPTVPAAGGYRRDCAACDTHHFPRTDPVVIMLIQRGERCLLGRSPRFKEAMYSCLAGFLEPGETIEAAVRRETFEEVGLRIGAVAYHTSQPWPFPASLMIGCIAEALDEAITLDAQELTDARWLTRDDVAAMIAGGHPEGLTVPPSMAIAHALMRAFVDGRT